MKICCASGVAEVLIYHRDTEDTEIERERLLKMIDDDKLVKEARTEQMVGKDHDLNLDKIFTFDAGEKKKSAHPQYIGAIIVVVVILLLLLFSYLLWTHDYKIELPPKQELSSERK